MPILRQIVLPVLGSTFRILHRAFTIAWLTNSEARDVVLKTDIPFLDLIPSHIDLVGAEIEMINYPNREMVLKQLIEPLRA